MTELSTMVETVNNQRSRSYVSDCHVFARWLARLKEAAPAERLAMISRDLDGDSGREVRELAEKVGANGVEVEGGSGDRHTLALDDTRSAT